MPWVPPKSLQYTPEEIPAVVKARTHLQKAEDVKEPHFRYLELWRGFEALYREQEKSASKVLANRQGGHQAGEMDLIASLLTSLSRPRLEQLLAHPEIPNITVALARKNLKRLVGENELLTDNGLTMDAYQLAKKDLQYNLKANYWKAGEALARFLYLVRGAADPKVRKTDNLVSDLAVLGSAYDVLRFAMRTLVDQMDESQQDFMGVGARVDVATKERQRLANRGKKA